jgi:hypothetical protein
MGIVPVHFRVTLVPLANSALEPTTMRRRVGGDCCAGRGACVASQRAGRWTAHPLFVFTGYTNMQSTNTSGGRSVTKRAQQRIPARPLRARDRSLTEGLCALAAAECGAFGGISITGLAMIY